MSGIVYVLERILLHLTNLESELKEIKSCVLQARVENSYTPIDYETLSPDQEAWMDEYEHKSSHDYKHNATGRPIRVDHD